LLIVILAACNTSSVSAVPAVDSVSQRFIQFLQSEYVPWTMQENQEETACYFDVADTPASKPEKLAQVIADCRSIEVSAAAASHNLFDHLGATPPPAKWQNQDDSLKQGVQKYIAYHAEQLVALDAKDVARILLNNVDEVAATFNYICAPIASFNAGPPVLSPPLPLPPLGEERAQCGHPPS
jgi:hypothetical protein